MKKFFIALPSFLASAFVALPILTCPACWPLYAGLLSALGLSFVDYTPFLFPVTAVLLFISLVSLAWKDMTKSFVKNALRPVFLNHRAIIIPKYVMGIFLVILVITASFSSS
ncbi:hypothetical protein SAMN05216325_12228 [Nitrosomonas marina]|uniref:Uncharacterized protein n=1 Tax=Nitrosomonas marina TaxID=917 RepID=A0A1H8H894_9PROT|nr:hypothetical protein SAMN05216325_12228 [Nitrosomonas marina]